MSSDAPPEALDIARSVVRRGVEPEALIHAYRRGQNLSWRRWMETAAATIPDKGEGPDSFATLSVFVWLRNASQTPPPTPACQRSEVSPAR